MVLSSTTSCPGRRVRTTLSVAAATKETSGSRLFESGVGTQMLMTSQAPRRPKSVVPTRRPAFTSVATSAAGTSGMYDRPEDRASTFDTSTSNPITFTPRCANATASGRPT